MCSNIAFFHLLCYISPFGFYYPTVGTFSLNILWFFFNLHISLSFPALFWEIFKLIFQLTNFSWPLSILLSILSISFWFQLFLLTFYDFFFLCFVSVIFSLISDYIYWAFLYFWWPTCSNHSASRSTHVLQSSVPLLCACSSRIWVCWLVHSYTLCLVKCMCSRTCDSPAPRVCAASEM